MRVKEGLRPRRAAPAEARAALWTGIGCFMLAFAIVFGFGLMVIDALPDPRGIFRHCGGESFLERKVSHA